MIDLRLLLTASMLLMLAVAHLFRVAGELAPVTSPPGRRTSLLRGIARCGHARCAMLLVAIAAVEGMLVFLPAGEHLGSMLVLPAFVVGAVAAWWLCFRNPEQLRLAAALVAIVGLLLLG